MNKFANASRSWPWQLRAIWSTESSEYHPVLEKRACMDEYDVEVSYRPLAPVTGNLWRKVCAAFGDLQDMLPSVCKLLRLQPSNPEHKAVPSPDAF
eukprot:1161576-Pelagomonas_calceolata.AAC.7